jgi:hypothetical protein
VDPSAVTFVVDHLVGKLVGVRLGVLRSMSHVSALSQRFFTVVDGVPGSVVICADYRRLEVMNEDVASAWTRDLVRANAKVQRSALLLPLRADVLRLQIVRVVREARNPQRRICMDAAEAKAWLKSTLDPAEMAGLDGFLAVRS